MELLRQRTADIVKGAANGDLGSFEQIVLLYQDKVYSLSLRLTGSAQDAEDLAQEVFVKAYRHITSFRGDSDFGTWIHRIAVNTWLNQKRKGQTQAAYSLDEPIYSGDAEIKREIPDLSQDPESVLLSSQMSEKLQRAVESLPKDQKAALLLREVEEYTYEEIAMMMGCSVGTVKSRLARARNALRGSLNGYKE